MSHTIAFPGLGIDFGSVDRVAFSVFGHDIMWYGVIIALGFLIAAIYVMKRSPEFGLNEDIILDALIFATPAAIICARAYYVIFNYSTYRYDTAAIFRIWDGGIAIYGAVIGAIVTACIFCKVRKIKIGALLDIASLGLLIGQFIGRWGNFVNAEAYGTVTKLPWGMSINGAATVHPTFLYESLWNLIGFIIIHFLSKKRSFRGQVFLMYIAWYGLGRGFIEGLRTDSLYLFGTGLRVSQLLAFASCIVAAALLFINLVFKNHSPSEVTELAYEPKCDPSILGSAENTDVSEDADGDLSSAAHDTCDISKDTDASDIKDDSAENSNEAEQA